MIERLTFVGGVGSVTGSAFLVEIGERRILLDSGLYQGPKELRKLNWAPFPVDPTTLDAIIVSHAHVDHVGAVPRLVTQGFTGPVLATPGTVELSRIVLPDSGHLHEEHAERANRHGYSRHEPALPLYTRADAVAALDHLEPVDFETATEVAPGVELRFTWAGHILGAATVQLSLPSGRRIVWSGDLGTADHPLLKPPAPCPAADIVLCESTYGDEIHEADPVQHRLREALNDTLDQSGVVVIPAFAVDRTEMVLWYLDRFTRDGELPRVPVFVDSPMASRALTVYRAAIGRGAFGLRDELVGGEPPFANLDLRVTGSVEESKAISARRGPFVVVSASGMATGGRVLHHLQDRLGDPRSCVVLVGFQAPSTRGRSLADGASAIKFFGSHHAVRARVVTIPLSAHTDQRGLLQWLDSAPRPPEIVYAVHGEPEASAALVEAAASELGLTAVVPHRGERITFG